MYFCLFFEKSFIIIMRGGVFEYLKDCVTYFQNNLLTDLWWNNSRMYDSIYSYFFVYLMSIYWYWGQISTLATTNFLSSNFSAQRRRTIKETQSSRRQSINPYKQTISGNNRHWLGRCGPIFFPAGNGSVSKSGAAFPGSINWILRHCGYNK